MDVTKLLRQLIEIPSVNPAFVADGDPNAGEERVAQFLAERGAKAGLEAERQAVLPGRPNLLLRLAPAANPRRRVLLAPHLDTVDAGADQFRSRAEAGRVYGRGACDTKGSVAAMFAALTDVAASGPRPKETELILVALVDEEAGQQGSRTLAASGLRADLAIVGEPTRARVVTAHKGLLWLSFAARGRAAHGARPELGRNAIRDMARVVAILEDEYAAWLRKRPHPLLGPGTISVGTIRGGTQPNIVPDRCRMDADRRTLPGETERAVRREILARFRKRGLRVQLSNCKPSVCPAMETDPDLDEVRRLMRAAGQRGPAGAVFFCDAGILAAGGIPSVVFGPGDIAQAHTAREWISVRSLERATRILTAYLRSLP